MPSFADSIFLFVLALLLFGPKKLPVLARELGKWMGEFRRASNEFKMQMDEELRASEQADRQKQIAAMEAAAPVPPPLDDPAEPVHPHLRHQYDPAAEPSLLAPSTPAAEEGPLLSHSKEEEEQPTADAHPEPLGAPALASAADGVRPIPIATSGSLKMMPPSTGLPTPRSRSNPLSSLVDAIPEAPAANSHAAPAESESIAHGD